MEEILFFALESRCRSGNSDRCCTTSPVIGPGSGFRNKNHLRDFVIACQGKGVNQSWEKTQSLKLWKTTTKDFKMRDIFISLFRFHVWEVPSTGLVVHYKSGIKIVSKF